MSCFITCRLGWYHVACISSDKVVYTCGSNEYGQLGYEANNTGFVRNSTTLPRPVPNLPKIKSVSCGYNFTMCLDENGDLWAFGDNSTGQLGLGSSMSKTNIPTKIPNIPQISFFYSGTGHSLCVSEESDLWTFGSNTHGELCLETAERESVKVPTKTNISDVILVRAGRQFSFCKNLSNQIYCAGYNFYGQLGFPFGGVDFTSKAILLNTQFPNEIISISCGYSHTLFLDSIGDVYGAGNNQFGALGLGDFLMK